MPGFSFPTLYATLHGYLAGSRLLIFSVGTRITEATLSSSQLLARRMLVRRAAACIGLSSDAVARFAELGCPPTDGFWSRIRRTSNRCAARSPSATRVRQDGCASSL